MRLNLPFLLTWNDNTMQCNAHANAKCPRMHTSMTKVSSIAIFHPMNPNHNDAMAVSAILDVHVRVDAGDEVKEAEKKHRQNQIAEIPSTKKPKRKIIEFGASLPTV